MRLIVLLYLVFSGFGTLPLNGFPGAPGVPVAIAVQDAGSEPLKDELVIVQNLDDHEKELARALTNDRGEIPPIDLRPGLYRAIATAPYGIWQTTVREFWVGDSAMKLNLAVEQMPTHGYGDIVAVGAVKMSLHVVDAAGKPVAGVAVLGRDRRATLHLERWYKTDTSGNVEMEMLGDPLVVVVLYGRTLVTREFSSKQGTETIRLPQ